MKYHKLMDRARFFEVLQVSLALEDCAVRLFKDTKNERVQIHLKMAE